MPWMEFLGGFQTALDAGARQQQLFQQQQAMQMQQDQFQQQMMQRQAEEAFQQQMAQNRFGLQQQQFDYGQQRDQVGDQFRNQAFDYQQQRDAVGDQRWNTQFGYDAGRDLVRDSQFAAQFSQQGRMIDHNINMGMSQEARASAMHPEQLRAIQLGNQMDAMKIQQMGMPASGFPEDANVHRLTMEASRQAAQDAANAIMKKYDGVMLDPRKGQNSVFDVMSPQDQAAYTQAIGDAERFSAGIQRLGGLSPYMQQAAPQVMPGMETVGTGSQGGIMDFFTQEAGQSQPAPGPGVVYPRTPAANSYGPPAVPQREVRQPELGGVQRSPGDAQPQGQNNAQSVFQRISSIRTPNDILATDGAGPSIMEQYEDLLRQIMNNTDWPLEQRLSMASGVNERVSAIVANTLASPSDALGPMMEMTNRRRQIVSEFQ